MDHIDTSKSGDLKEEVVKAGKEEGKDYLDDYEREKKVFEEDSVEEAFGIDKFDGIGVDSNESGVKVPESEAGTDYGNSYELEEGSNEIDGEDSYEFDEDSEYYDDNSNYSDLYYESDESDVFVKKSKKPKSKTSEDGQDYNNGNNMKDDTGSLRKTFYQSHIYPMHLLENLKVCTRNQTDISDLSGNAKKCFPFSGLKNSILFITSQKA